MKKLLFCLLFGTSVTAVSAYNFYYPFLGTNPNDGTGDPLRVAGIKYNSNFMMIATSQGAVVQNIFTTNQFFNGFVDANSNVWLISATAVPMNTWYMPNIALGGQQGNVPLIMNTGGQSDGNVIGGQFIILTNCGYNIGSIMNDGVTYTTNMGNDVCNVLGLLDSQAYGCSFNSLIGSHNYYTNCTSSQLGGALVTYIGDYGETAGGYNNSVTTCSFGFHGGSGNTSIGDMSQVTLGGTGSGANGNTSLHNSDGYLNGASTYALNNIGSTISALNSFCVSNYYCNISGVGMQLTNNYYSTYQGLGHYSTNAVGCSAIGATNMFYGYPSYCSAIGLWNQFFNTNVSCYATGNSNTFLGNDACVTLNGHNAFATNCHNCVLTGDNCGFTNFNGGYASGTNGVWNQH